MMTVGFLVSMIKPELEVVLFDRKLNIVAITTAGLLQQDKKAIYDFWFSGRVLMIILAN